MLNPQSLLPRERTEKPKLAVLLDTSASMATRDLGTDSRLAAALRTLTNPATLATLNKDFVLDIRRFDREAHPADLAQLGTNVPAGDATDLGKAVMSAASELGETKAQAGVLVVSDGRATTPDTLEAAQLALARSVPLWTWTLGGPVPRHDLWVETASAEALAFSGAEVELAATLHQVGYPNRSFKVDILRGDQLIDTQGGLAGHQRHGPRVCPRQSAGRRASSVMSSGCRLNPRKPTRRTTSGRSSCGRWAPRCGCWSPKASRTGTPSSSSRRSSATRMWTSRRSIT